MNIEKNKIYNAECLSSGSEGEGIVKMRWIYGICSRYASRRKGRHTHSETEKKLRLRKAYGADSFIA